jgi:hypothetical protein
MVRDASPLVRNVSMHDANWLHDIVMVYGEASAPRFERLSVSGAHCAFHFEYGSGIVVRDSVIADVEYGVMNVAATGTQIEGTTFGDATIGVGFCFAEAPALRGNYYGGAAVDFDSLCLTLGATDAEAADEPPAGIGPAD